MDRWGSGISTWPQGSALHLRHQGLGGGKGHLGKPVGATEVGQGRVRSQSAEGEENRPLGSFPRSRDREEEASEGAHWSLGLFPK